MPDTATALLIEVQADGLARERVLSAQVYSANEPDRYWGTTRQPVPVSGSPSAARTRRKGTPPHVVSQDVQGAPVAHQYWKYVASIRGPV